MNLFVNGGGYLAGSHRDGWGSRDPRGRAGAKGWEGGSRASRERMKAGDGEERWEGKEGEESHRKAEHETGREERWVGGLGERETQRVL